MQNILVKNLVFEKIYFYNINYSLGTFKAKKTSLVEEGYNINQIKDKLFYFDTKQQNYLPLTKQIYEEIQQQKLKL